MSAFKSHKQMFLHDPDNDQYGDCHRTAIAMVIGFEPEHVPHFCDPNQFPDWRKAQDEWLAERGLAMVDLPYTADFDLVCKQLELTASDVPAIVSGYSPRGTLHSVVVHHGILYDPHPEGGGIVRPHDDGFLWISFIAPALRTAA